MVNPPIIIAQNNPKSVLFMIQQVKAQIFFILGLLEGLFNRKIAVWRIKNVTLLTQKFCRWPNFCPTSTVLGLNNAKSVQQMIQQIKVRFFFKRGAFGGPFFSKRFSSTLRKYDSRHFQVLQEASFLSHIRNFGLKIKLRVSTPSSNRLKREFFFRKELFGDLCFKKVPFSASAI